MFLLIGEEIHIYTTQHMHSHTHTNAMCAYMQIHPTIMETKCILYSKKFFIKWIQSYTSDYYAITFLKYAKQIMAAV